MRLRTFESFWLLKNGLLYTYPMLKQDISTEIVVVGGGISGALICHALVEAGYKTILIDKRDIGLGSTSATTSMLQYEIDTPMYELAQMIGEEGSAICYKAGIEAINKIEKLVEDNNINCGFQKKKSLYIAHNKKAKKWLYKEFLIRDKYQLGVKWLDENTVKEEYGLNCNGGILSNDAASVDAYQLAHELVALNVKKGLKVYDQTTISKYNYHKQGVELITGDGHKINGNKIIFCTGYEATSMLKEKLAKLIYTWATISEENINLPANLKDTLIWNTDDPYLYMRTTGDGRLLVGGEDSSYKTSLLNTKTKEQKSKKLMSKLNSLMGDIAFIEDHNWGGVFGTTKDGLPYIGQSPEIENALFVLGFGGNGITFSIQAMEIIINLLANKQNSLSHYYRFGR